MNNLIKTLEKMGQNASLKQYASVNDMAKHLKVDDEMLSKAFIQSSELICAHEPEDDEG